MTSERLCGWHECNKPLIQRPGEHESNFRDRLTCNQSCGSKLGQWRAKQSRASGVTFSGRPEKVVEYVPPWPRVTGEWPARWLKTRPFARHNCAAGDGGYFHRPRVEDTRSFIGSTGAMLVRSAPS